MVRRKNPFERGFEFENAFESMMQPLLKENDWRMLSDVNLISNSQVGHSQIDFVLFTPYKYLCIEAKGWTGETKCTDGEFWEVKYNDRYYRTLSPVKQNYTHVRRLCEYVEGYKVSGLVCFSDSAVLWNKTPSIMSFSQVPMYLRELSKMPKIVSEDEMYRDYCKVRTASMFCFI